MVSREILKATAPLLKLLLRGEPIPRSTMGRFNWSLLVLGFVLPALGPVTAGTLTGKLHSWLCATGTLDPVRVMFGNFSAKQANMFNEQLAQRASTPDLLNQFVFGWRARPQAASAFSTSGQRKH